MLIMQYKKIFAACQVENEIITNWEDKGNFN